MEYNQIHNMDCLDGLKDLDDNSVDLICTDPPYGLKFMGKDWDKALPNPEVFKECYRVLKPGAWITVMSAPRSDLQSRMSLLLEDAGFNIGYTPIYWTFASGFPKAGNLGKMADKRLGTYKEGKPTQNARFSERDTEKGNYSHSKITREFNAQSDEAKALDGSYAGFQPKPAVEVVIVAMKPLSEKTYIDQALKSLEDESVGLGGSWLDDARIPYKNEGDVDRARGRKGHYDKMNVHSGNEFNVQFNEPYYKAEINNNGRFPANLLVSDDVLNDGKERGASIRTSGCRIGKGKPLHGWDKKTVEGQGALGYPDSGSFSRYFDLDAWWNKQFNELPESVQKTYPFLLVPKASKSEKNKGCEELEENKTAYDYGNIKKTPGRHGKNTLRKNHHPTVKPIKLFTYLITLFSRPGQTVLDPYAGSGTTCIAAKLLKRDYIGFELENEYKVIADARLKAHQPEPQISLTTF